MATLKISKTLRERGHRVRFLTTKKQLAGFINSHGFDAWMVDDPHAKLHRPCLIPGVPYDGKSSPWQQTGSVMTSHTDQVAKIQKPCSEQEEDTHVPLVRSIDQAAKTLEENNVDLVLLDPLVWPYAISAARARAKVLHLSGALVYRANSRTPPSFYSRIPVGSWFDRARVICDWQRLRFYRWRRDCRRGLLSRLTSTRAVLREQIRQVPVPLIYGDYGHMFDFPQVIMMPREFDFPSAQRWKSHRYMSSTVDLERAEPVSFDFARLHPQRPLVICSLGTYAFPWMESFFGKFIQAMSHMPLKQAILNLGPTVSPSQLPASQNVILIGGIPQLALLKRASVMVTASGINTVKECVASGVPMVCLPCLNDQPGTAARVVHHGLGLRGDIKTLTVEALVLKQASQSQELGRSC